MEKSNKDSNKTISNVSHLSTHISEGAFDRLDRGAKKLSEWKRDNEKILEDEEDVKSGLATSNDDSDYTTNEEPPDDSSTSSGGSFSSRLETKASVEDVPSNDLTSENRQQTTNDAYSSRLKTSISQESTNEISSVENFETSIEDTVDLENETVDSSVAEESKLKTGISKSLSFLNKHTFQFTENQKAISKTVTVIGKTGKGVSKSSRSLIKTSKVLNRAIDSEDGAGAKFIQGSASRMLSKRVGYPLLKKLMNFAMKMMAKVGRLLVSALSGIPMITPLIMCVAIVISIGLIFGSNGSKSVVSKYETYMQEIQNEYDADVDEFMKDNPDGIVVGVRGGYGQISWKAPLSIIQGVGESLDCDQAEKTLIEHFRSVGLLERHEISEQTVTYKDDEDKEQEKTIKVLTIVNSGYADYMRYLNNETNFACINAYSLTKSGKISANKGFTRYQKKAIESLYSSQYFFQEFSTDFQEHNVSKGSNTTEEDFNHPAYNSENIFTKAGYKGQCTWYVYGRALKLTGKKMPSGDAQTWLTSAIALGYPTGINPSKNAVVVLSGGDFGHVAFVESWDGKKMTVSEGNYNNPCAKGTCNMVDYANQHPVELVHEQTYSSFEEYKKINLKSGLTVVGFIYLE